MKITQAEISHTRDLQWVLNELKKGDLANTRKDLMFSFSVLSSSKFEPTEASKRRIVDMLVEKRAIKTKPFWVENNLGLNGVYQSYGLKPNGFYIELIDHNFEKLYIEFSTKKQIDNSNFTYSISYINQRLILNEKYLLATPNFNSENDRFMSAVITKPNEKLEKIIFSSLGSKIKKPFNQILNDLGFKKELRKLFFSVSKTIIEFRNDVPIDELVSFGVDIKLLEKQLTKLPKVKQR